MSDAEFHENLVELLARVRDRHVIFLGRAHGAAAMMLPIETCWENGIKLYVVTKVDPGTATRTLKPGARVSYWNGIPIDRYIRLSANLFDGGNEAAALTRSLAFLTHRPLNRFGPPLEWVDLASLSMALRLRSGSHGSVSTLRLPPPIPASVATSPVLAATCR